MVVFVCSSAGSYISYAMLVEKSAGNDLFDLTLFKGKHDFVALSSGKCVGELKTDLFKEDEKLQFKAEGSLRALFRNEVFFGSFKALSQFNSLDQLGALYVEIKVRENSFVFGLQNVNPIRATFIAKKPGQQRLKHEIEVPGPISLVLKNDGSYRVNYAYLPDLKVGSMSSLSMPLLKDLDFSIIPLEESRVECGDNTEDSIDLTSQINLLLSLSSRAESWLKFNPLPLQQFK